MYFLWSKVASTWWLCCLVTGILLTGPVGAHEFWIEPTRYQIEKDSELVAYLRNGDKFSGYDMAYITPQTVRFDLVTREGGSPVVARLGDNPALKMKPVQPGLNIVVHQSTASVITYATWKKFQRFAEHKDFLNPLKRHRDRSLPETQFREAYIRYSKSLIAVGNGEGSDLQTGLDVELVASQNPYTDDVSKGMQLTAYYKGKVRADAQIELFEKTPASEVKVTLHRTDSQGNVVLPIKPLHSYLVDMVVLREPSQELAEQKNVVWETLWASLTFAVP